MSADWSAVLGEEEGRASVGAEGVDAIDLTFSPDEPEMKFLGGEDKKAQGSESGKEETGPAKKSADESARSTGSAPGSGKIVCDACDRTIRKDQIAHMKGCPCGKFHFHSHQSGGKNCCTGLVSIGAALAKSLGYEREDGTGDLEHPD
eukprot:591551-Rhodomonas_salina.1